MHQKHYFSLLGSLSLAIAGWIALPLYAQSTTSLNVVFKDLRSSDGQVCLNLFSGPKGFPQGGAESNLAMSRCAPVANGVASVMLSDLPPGQYAISAYHDANNDGQMNKGAFGIPEEGFGFSNNPTIGFSAPTFDETQFQVSGSQSEVLIQLRYLN
ncbi:MAG: DUF2141 domain-containing protein [Thermosynechococcaceae cyanobacterium]